MNKQDADRDELRFWEETYHCSMIGMMKKEPTPQTLAGHNLQVLASRAAELATAAAKQRAIFMNQQASR